MTTPMRTEGSPTNKRTRTTELVCPCGKRLEISVDKNGWLLSLLAITLAHRWKLKDATMSEWSEEIDATCPTCRAPEQCQCRDC